MCGRGMTDGSFCQNRAGFQSFGLRPLGHDGVRLRWRHGLASLSSASSRIGTTCSTAGQMQQVLGETKLDLLLLRHSQKLALLGWITLFA